MSTVAGDLAAALGAERVRLQVTLASLTTLKVGGPADVLIETATAEEIVTVLRVSHRHGVPVTLLGGGSNVLIGDRGIRGVVIRPRGGSISPIGRRAPSAARSLATPIGDSRTSATRSKAFVSRDGTAPFSKCRRTGWNSVTTTAG
jgi:hypothetical protein